MKMSLFYMILILTSTSSQIIRNMKMKVYPNAYYQLGYFGNFISNVTTRSLMRCAIACQNNDQCRLANYNSQTWICSLIDESSFVGKMITSTSKVSVIILQLCENSTKQEPAYLCFGSFRPAVTVEHAITNARSVRNISQRVYIARFSPTGLLYMQQHASDIVRIYELKAYTQIQQPTMFSGTVKENFDADFSQNYFAFTGHSGYNVTGIFVISSTGNKTLGTTTQYWGICLSERYIIATQKINNFLTDNAGIKSTSITNRTNTTLKSWPYTTCQQGWTNMAIDSSGRTYIACVTADPITCMGNPSCSIVSNGLNNTPLAIFNNYWYTAGRASKYKYRFVATDYQSILVNIFEY